MSDSPGGRPAPRAMGYIAGFDGIRAIAVLAVLLFHGDVGAVPGGFLGVDVFFVLSGYLITSLLLREIARDGDVSFGRFYARRARRLLPAVAGVLALSALLCLTVARDAAAQFGAHALASLTYVTNWFFIASDQSYFEVMGRPAMLQHLWSLAVEEQFYLLWPVAMVLMYRSGGRSLVGRIALLTALGSTLLMAMLSLVWGMPGLTDASRLYFGTDTHCMGLLLGAALATVWRPGELPERVRRPVGVLLWAGGVAALTGLFAIFHTADEGSVWLYQGGFLVVSALTAAVVAVAAHPSVSFGALLAVQPMEYLGQRSYGIYLYHWPIFVVTRPELDIPLGGPAAFGLRCGLTIAVAEVSYRYLEMPVRRGALATTWRSWRARGRGVAVAVASAALLAVASVVGATAAAVSAVPAQPAGDYLQGVTSVGRSLSAEAQRRAAVTAGTARPLSAAPAPVSTMPPAPQTVDHSHDWIVAIGDSVMLGARTGLERHLTVSVDAEVSRDWPGVQQRIDSRKAYGLEDDVVVIHTGTNGPVDRDGLRGILRSLRNSSLVVLVTVRTPRWWMGDSNAGIHQVASEFPNVRIADWEATTAGHPEYFVIDGTHLTQQGIAAYTGTIRNALRGTT